MTVVVALALFLLRPALDAAFGLTGPSRDIVFLFAGPLALLWFFNGVIFVANAAFNNLGHPFHSTWINWGRHTVGTLPLVWAGSALMGAPGVLLGQALGGILFAIIAWWLALRVIDGRARPDARPGFHRQLRLWTQLLNRR